MFKLQLYLKAGGWGWTRGGLVGWCVWVLWVWGSGYDTCWSVSVEVGVGSDREEVERE